MNSLLKLTFLVTLITIIACDGPRNARSRRGASADAFTSSNDHSGQSRNSNEDDIVPVVGDDGTNSTIPTEIQHCQWSTDGQNGFQSSSSHLGSYTFCQARSPGQETDVYIQLKNPVTDSQICVIPTFNNGSTSIYVGEARCLTAVDNKKIYKIGLLKNRPGYSNFSITGAMIMRDKAFFYPTPFNQYLLSPDAYLFCSNFLDQYGDASYCQAFKSINEYQYHQF